MNAQQLRNSILQEAIEGRLVPQDPNDEPASVLLDKIRAEKKRLVKEGKLKKKDLEETPISEDEKPFEIPDSWEWVRLKSVASKIVDGDHNPPRGLSSDSGYYMLSSKNIFNDNVVISDDARFLSYEDWKKCNERTNLKKGDVLLTTVATLGRSCVYEDNVPYCFQRSVSIIHTSIFNYFLKYCFDSPYYQYLINDKATGTAQRGFYLNQLEESIIPLPPLAEQKRIVAKIEELLPKVEEYGKAQDSLDKLNEELPERLKKSVLQEAIEGRLVPQDPNDEPASVLLERIREEKKRLVKEGKLKKKDLEETPISEDEIPFDIPESWEWCRVGTVGEVITGGTPSKSESKYYGDEYPFYKPADLEQGLNTYKSVDSLSVEGYNHSRKLPKDSVLVTCIGSIGKSGIIRKEGACNQQINAVIPCNKLIIPEYLYYHITSSFFQESMWDSSSSTTLAILNKNKFSQLIIALPPLAEQKRIVAKIEEVFKEIDKF